MHHVVTGFVSFKKEELPKHRKRFAELANGQNPDVLFIIRNAGNIVPPHGRSAGGVTASIE